MRIMTNATRVLCVFFYRFIQFNPNNSLLFPQNKITFVFELKIKRPAIVIRSHVSSVKIEISKIKIVDIL